MWRTASGGHKFKSNKWWQACRDFFLWGLVIVWAFLNMKLSKPNDNRPMWKFKHSLINEYKNEAQKLGFRRRNSTRVETMIPEKKPKLKATRQKRNPYKCELGKKQSRDRRLMQSSRVLRANFWTENDRVSRFFWKGQEKSSLCKMWKKHRMGLCKLWSCSLFGTTIEQSEPQCSELYGCRSHSLEV